MNVCQDGAPTMSPQPRFASAAEWLAWRRDWERGRQEIAEANEAKCRTLLKLLPPDAVMDGRPLEYGDRIETIYPIRRLAQRADGNDRIWILGPSMPMSQAELEDHFSRQTRAISL
jgi:hypothetical protein